MSKTISDASAEALAEIIHYVWDEAKNHVIPDYPTEEEALKAWKEGCEGGALSGVAGEVLTAWEDICGESAEELLKSLYEGK